MKCWTSWMRITIIVLLVLLITLAIICFCTRSGAESFTTPIAADLIFVYRDGPDSKTFTPTWAKFTDDYRHTLEAAGVNPHKLNENDPAVKQYTLQEYPAILLTAPNHGALKTKFAGHRTVETLADFVHTSFPTFDKNKFRRS